MRNLNVVIPKGRIFDNVFQLFCEAGIRIDIDERDYRPAVSDEEIVMKIMKPQDIPRLLELGSHDIGFTGYDWVMETDTDVVEVMDLGFDPVKIVAAVPDGLSDEQLRTKKIIVASEYATIARTFLEEKGYKFELLTTSGATEVFPPDDADMIIDNTSTGRTLREHNLRIIETLMESSTRFIANKAALADPGKEEKIYELKMLFQAVFDARGRVMLEMNIPADKFKQIVRILPCMRSPTVAPLYKEEGFAVKVAVEKQEAARLIPQLKRLGAGDILEYEISKVVI